MPVYKIRYVFFEHSFLDGGTLNIVRIWNLEYLNKTFPLCRVADPETFLSSQFILKFVSFVQILLFNMQICFVQEVVGQEDV